MSSLASPRCDIVLPVYNNLAYVKQCVTALLKYTPANAYHLYIIDDAGDQHTHQWLAQQAAEHRHISLLRNSENLGFVKSCNRGMQAGQAPFVLLLNSDVILTPNSVQRLLNCASADPQIASVNPLTNHAAQIQLPMPPGMNFFDLDAQLAQRIPDCMDVVTGVGFCMLLRREALEQVGLFDEIYGRGYCEESDLCMRLVQRGWRTVVADHVYVYHQGKVSFRDPGAAYRHNRQIFDQRWDKEYQRQFKAFKRLNPLGPLRAHYSYANYWQPMPRVWVTYRQFIQAWQQRHYPNMAMALLRGAFHALRARQPWVSREQANANTRSSRLRVTYVLPKLVIAGGVLSVVQLVNELILLGIEARIATLFEDLALGDWQMLSRPLVYRSTQELIRECPDSDIFVATHWQTAPWVAKILDKRPTAQGAYFIQDYEAWFYPQQEERQAAVRATYSLLEHRIVKSAWLKDLLAKDGYHTQQIRLGMNLDVFYPRDRQTPAKQWTILAMARPGTPQRGFNTLKAVLEQFKQLCPQAHIVLFGDSHLAAHPLPFEYEDAGIVSQRDQLAQLYSNADVYLDLSNFQGFGRPGLEAMACGCVCILTLVGGVNEYARSGENCLGVEPQDPAAVVAALQQLMHDNQLRQNLREQGFATVADYDLKREARETLAYFSEIHSHTPHQGE